MATDLNVLVLSGRLGDDPEVKEVGSTELGKFPLGVSVYKGKDRDPETMWIDVQVWGNRVAVCEYLRKGMQITVSGQLNKRTYEKDNGDKGISVAIDADSIILPPKEGGEERGGGRSSRGGGERSERSSGRGGERSSSRGSGRSSGSARSSARSAPKDDDDLPF